MDLDVFFGFDGLVEAVGVAAAGHEAAGEFVHDDDFAVLDDVVAVTFKDGLRFERVFGEVDEGEVVRAVDVGDV